MTNEEREVEANEKASSILCKLVNVEFAMFGYFASIVDFMDSFKGDHTRKRVWEETAGKLMLQRYVSGEHSPTYDTIKAIYYRIKKLKETNNLHWELAVMYYAWGGDGLTLKHPVRHNAPHFRRRKAIRVGLADIKRLSNSHRQKDTKNKLKEFMHRAEQELGIGNVFTR